MRGYILRRALHGIAVLISVMLTVFVLSRIVGDPVKLMLPFQATAEQRQHARESLGLDRPIGIQLIDYLGQVARLQFGDSLWLNRPAIEVVLDYLPQTLILMASGLGLAAIVAPILGIIAAKRPGSLVDKTVITASLVGLSVPQFWLGLVLILIFSVALKALPTSGTGGIAHLVLPAITLALPAIGRLTMVVRGAMLEELNRAYVQTAIAKGLPATRITLHHALRIASLPFVNLFGWEMIRAFAGYTVVVEVVFGWNGLGNLAFTAIERQDFALVQATVLFVAAAVLVTNMVFDIIERKLDPRMELQ